MKTERFLGEMEMQVGEEGPGKEAKRIGSAWDLKAKETVFRKESRQGLQRGLEGGRQKRAIWVASRELSGDQREEYLADLPRMQPDHSHRGGLGSAAGRFLLPWWKNNVIFTLFPALLL